MNKLLSVAATIAAGCFATGVSAQTPSIVGNWTWTDDNDCVEIYSYGADGSFSVTSGEEETSGSFEISPLPDSNGFRLVTGRTIETNGKPDCAGKVAESGTNEFFVYVAFHPVQPMHVVCREPTLESCFGPLERTESVAPGPGRTGFRF